ncbi:MAG: hypothetical protein ACFCU3_06320 [Verrucomicrobiales bacterium]
MKDFPTHGVVDFCPGEGLSDPAIKRVVTLAKLANFPVLKLPGATLSVAGLAELGRAEGILSLDLSNSILESSGLHFLGYLDFLEVLSLRGTLIQDYEFFFLEKLQKLRSLDVRDSEFSDYSMGWVQSRVLEEIWLSRTLVSSDSFARLIELPQLRRVHLEGTSFSASELEIFADHGRIQLFL